MFFRRSDPDLEVPRGAEVIRTPPYTIITLIGANLWNRMRDVEIKMAGRGRPGPRSQRPPVRTIKGRYTMEWPGDERGPLLEIGEELQRNYGVGVEISLGGTFVEDSVVDADVLDVDADVGEEEEP